MIEVGVLEGVDFMFLSIISDGEASFEEGVDEDALGEEEGGEDHDSFAGDEGKLGGFGRFRKLYPPHSNDF